MTTGTEWSVRGDIRLRNGHKQKIPEVRSQLTWQLITDGSIPPPRMTYDNWIICENYFQSVCWYFKWWCFFFSIFALKLCFFLDCEFDHFFFYMMDNCSRSMPHFDPNIVLVHRLFNGLLDDITLECISMAICTLWVGVLVSLLSYQKFDPLEVLLDLTFKMFPIPKHFLINYWPLNGKIVFP